MKRFLCYHFDADLSLTSCLQFNENYGTSTRSKYTTYQLKADTHAFPFLCYEIQRQHVTYVEDKGHTQTQPSDLLPVSHTSFPGHHPPHQLNQVLSPCFCVCLPKTIYFLIYMFLNLKKSILFIFLLVLCAKLGLWIQTFIHQVWSGLFSWRFDFLLYHYCVYGQWLFLSSFYFLVFGKGEIFVDLLFTHILGHSL